MVKLELSNDFRHYNVVMDNSNDNGDVEVVITNEFTNGKTIEEPYAFYVYSGHLKGLINENYNDLRAGDVVSDTEEYMADTLENGAKKASKPKKKKSKPKKPSSSRSRGSKSQQPGIIESGNTEDIARITDFNSGVTINDYLLARHKNHTDY